MPTYNMNYLSNKSLTSIKLNNNETTINQNINNTKYFNLRAIYLKLEHHIKELDCLRQFIYFLRIKI
jgi:hypothetical protein